MIREKEKLVRKLLADVKSTRDSDNKLVSAYWNLELKAQGINIHEITARELLVHIWNGNLSSTESITRCRRKVQELSPELRGEKWDIRHNELQEEVVSEVREMENA